jgi:hypothetical protein
MCRLTCPVDGTESVWKKAAAKHQYYLFPGAITAYNGAQHFHSHLPDIHDELVPKALEQDIHVEDLYLKICSSQLYRALTIVYNLLK